MDSYANKKFRYDKIGTVAKGCLDVKFDGKNYTVSNVKGTFGMDGDLSEIESGSNDSIYLKVPAELINNNRSQTEVDSLDHSDDFDKNVARSAFENFGKLKYPYGFKCHFILDLRSEEQSSVNGSWFFKVGVKITDQYYYY